jgi:hypothetical protein
VFDTAQYMDKPGWYCPGQDTVSQNIGIHGQWEPTDSAVIGKILADGDKRHLVIDFGAHVGWYTVMAAKAGYRVIASTATQKTCACYVPTSPRTGLKPRSRRSTAGWTNSSAYPPCALYSPAWSW